MYSSARAPSSCRTSWVSCSNSSMGKVSSAAIPWSKLNVTGTGGSGKNSGGPLRAMSENSEAASIDMVDLSVAVGRVGTGASRAGDGDRLDLHEEARHEQPGDDHGGARRRHGAVGEEAG